MSLDKHINPAVTTGTDALSESFRSAGPFRHVVIDDFFTPGFCRALIAEFPEFDEKLAVNEDGIVGGKAVREKISGIGPAYRDLDALVQSRDFRDLVGRITSISDLKFDPHYFGGGTHENREGQGLDAHVDFNYHPVTNQHRRLNLIVYLNPEWNDAWGGSLQLHRDPYLTPSEDEIKVVTPLANRCVIFETNEYSWHGFPRIQLPEDRKDLSRKSFALYYYTDERPAEETASEHSTIYVGEHLPESYHAGMTLEAGQLQHVRNLLASRDQHLKRLYGFISDLNDQVAGYRAQIAQVRAGMPEGSPDVETLLAENPELEAWVSELQSRLASARARVVELEQSTSWKVTAPLRKIKTMLTTRH